ncbi:hypothetical protein DFH07DRAFT_1056003 [Mycena maculata]|uniref:Uncharacterized protein n=1 Tax=Mycena maculata TaxID=230809 RepID=A0AAD7K6Y1_9AGAR|nr:hypothetical protein DFH07DRAFT_1056003 [Mycena maculata]
MARLVGILLLMSAVVFAAPILPRNDQVFFDMPVFTATREYKTITDVPPYIVTRTTTITWTQESSTTFAFPTGPGN